MWPFRRREGGSKEELRAPAPTAERRKEVRLAVGAPTVVVLPGDPNGVRAFIRDISKGGCRLDTEAGNDIDIAVGATVSLAFLGKPKTHCRAVGRVVRKGDHGGFGVEFSQANMAFLAFVGVLGSAPQESRGMLIAAMKGSTVEVRV